MLSVMEPINVTLISVFKEKGKIRARARAVAHDAEIMIEVRFRANPKESKSRLWEKAREEVLRYLDIA